MLEQKAGELYKNTPEESQKGLKKGANPPLDTGSPTGKQSLIQESGKHQSTFKKWAKESDIQKEKILEYESLCNTEGKELTSAGLLYFAIPKKTVESPPIPENVYRIIYADPPWKYSSKGITISTDLVDDLKKAVDKAASQVYEGLPGA